MSGETEELLTAAEVAEELGVHRSPAHKIIRRPGVSTRQIKGESGQAEVHIWSLDLPRIREAAHRPGGAAKRLDLAESDDDAGVFYLIQLEPDLAPGRFKVGYTDRLERRSQKFRSVVLMLQVVQIWPCRRGWEFTAIAAITAGCERLGAEVFETDRLEAVVERANSFFALLPSRDQAS